MLCVSPAFDTASTAQQDAGTAHVPSLEALDVGGFMRGTRRTRQQKGKKKSADII